MSDASVSTAALAALAAITIAGFAVLARQNREILSSLKREGELEMATWNELKATVASKDSIDESFKAFATGLLAKLEEVKDEPTSNDIQAMIDDINKHGQDFADAMKANTDAADEPSTVEEEAQGPNGTGVDAAQ